MNQQRAYGIEIECASSENLVSVAAKIHAAIHPYGHRCISVNSYYHNTEGTNFTRWEVKTDSSIEATNSHPYKVEIVSPVLKGVEGLVVLDAVCNAIQEFTVVNTSTGLHVHHGVGAHENLPALVNAWIDCEGALVDCVPASRRANRYCQRWNSGIRRDKMTNTDVRGWWRMHGFTRYTTLNLESYWIRGTVEYRWAAGSTDFEKISNWILVTQAITDRGLAGTITEPQNLESLIAVLKGGINQTVNTGRPRVPARGTKAHVIFDGVQAGMNRQQILARLREVYGAGEYRISSVIRDVFGGSAYLTPTGYKLHNTVDVNIPMDDDYANACGWLQQRAEHFAARA